MKFQWPALKRALSFSLILTAALSWSSLAHADALDDGIRNNYKNQSNKPRASKFPRKVSSRPDLFESPNGNKITRVTSILKPPPFVADGLFKTAYYAAAENKYWVHVTGGIAGFNYWEGSFDYAVPVAIGKVPFTDVSKGVHSGARFAAGANGAENLVVTDDAGWNSLVARHSNLSSVTKPDFNKSIVLAVFMGLKSTGGYSTQITNIHRPASGDISVFYDSKSPAPGTIVTQAFTAPYHVVKIDKIPGKFKFVLNNNNPTPNLGPIPYKIMDSGSISGYRERSPRQLTIRDAAAWNAFYARHKPNDRAPGFDFTKEVITVLLSGEKPSGGFGIKTNSVERTAANQIRVTGEETSPAPGSFVTTVITYPYQIIRYKAARSDVITYTIKGSQNNTPKFTEITLDRNNASARVFERLTVESTGKALYELRDSNGKVIKSHQETLTPTHLKDTSKQIQGADFYNMADPSRQPGYNPPMGGSIYTLRAEDNPTNSVNKISYHGATPRRGSFNDLHKNLENLIDKFANVATTVGVFKTLTLREVRPQGNGSSFSTTTTTTLNVDGTITRSVTAPNIRSIPVTGHISPADLGVAKQLFIATDFMNQSFATPLFSPGTPLTTLTVEAGGNKKGVTHPTSTLGGAKGQEVLALEKFLRDVTIVQGFRAFDNMKFSTALNGFILDVKTLDIDKSGNATWSQNRNGQQVSNEKGALTQGEINEINRLYAATDFMNQSFRPFFPGAGASYNNLSVTAAGNSKTFGHPVGTYTGPKATEIKALEDYLATLLKRGPKATGSFDQLTYTVKTLATGETEEIFVKGNDVQWRKADAAGNSIDKKQIKLTAAELSNLQGLYASSDYFNQPATFPQTRRIVRSHDYTLDLEANGQKKSISASIYADEPGNFAPFRQELHSLLGRFKGAQLLTVTGRVSIRESFPPQIVINDTTNNKLYRVVGSLETEVQKLGGRTVKVQGTEDANGNLDVSAILSPKQVTFTGVSSSKGGNITLVKNNTSHVVLGNLRAAVARFRGQTVSVEALQLENGDLEVQKVLTEASRNTFALPFAGVRKGDKVDIIRQFGRNFSLVRINNSGQVFFMRTGDLKPRKVTTTTGLRGALRGSR